MKEHPSISYFLTDLLADIDKMCEEYMEKIRGLSPPEKKDYLSKIESAFKKSREYGDDKVQLAIQTYEMVCKIISKLEIDTVVFLKYDFWYYFFSLI